MLSPPTSLKQLGVCSGNKVRQLMQEDWRYKSPVFVTCSGMHHHGMRQLEMWMQTLVPGTAIPPHTHGGEEVVIVLKVTSSAALVD